MLAGAEFEDFPEHAGRHGRNRIDTEHRRTGRADDLIGHADQSLVAAAAKEQAQDRNLAEHVVEPVHRNQGAAHAHLISGIIDAALDGPADHRAFRDTFANRQLPVLPGKFRAHQRECDAVLNSALPARSQPIERGLTLDGEILDVDQALFRLRLGRRRFHRQRKLASNHFGVGIGEAEERASVVGLEIDDVAALRTTAQISGQGGIPSKLAAERKAPDHAIAP